jgi:polyadenylate-binding protein
VDKDVTEAQLYDLFVQIGPVASIRVCRDAVTRRSLGYAYINYNGNVDPLAAERALTQLNYHQLNGKPLRIMWSHRDPAFRKSGVGNIFIKNLDKSIDHKALHDTFSAFGNILSCKVAIDAAGQSKGYGFVHYEKEEDAQLAIEKVNGMLLEGVQVFVGPFLKRSDRPNDKGSKFTNVYIKNLADTVDEEKLRKLFAESGNITSVVIMKDDEGKSKGFGFINFDTPEAAAEAVEKNNGTLLEGKELWCGRAQKKAEREAELKQRYDDARQEKIAKYQGMNLYIKNLADDVDDDKLRTEFAPHGTITSAKVMRDSNQKSRGFGFVCYTSPEEATRAVTEMNGRMVEGKPIYVALAQLRDIRKAQLEQQYAAPRIPGAGMPGPPGGRGGPLPGMYPPQPQFQPQFYAGPGPMGPPPGRPNGPGMAQMYPQMVPRGMPGRGRGPPMPYGGPPQGPYGPGPAGMYGPGPAGRFGGRGRGMRGRGEPAGGRGRMIPPMGRGGRGGAPPPPPPQAAPTPGSGPAPSAVVPGHEGGQLTTAMLAAADPEAQKQMLGERLFPLVSRKQPELAGKITGMLLEMDNSELLLLLESEDALDLKVGEAITVLKQHNALPDGAGVENGPVE